MTPELLQSRFPAEIPFPDALGELCNWDRDHPGHLPPSFGLTADIHDMIRHWFGTDTVVDRFAVFGMGYDGSLYAFWKQDDGRCPVVHLGSEGQNNIVLAGDFVDFLCLLAIGYDEIGFSNLEEPSPKCTCSRDFADWVAAQTVRPIPKCGIEITGPAQARHAGFQAWIDRVIDTTGH